MADRSPAKRKKRGAQSGKPAAEDARAAPVAARLDGDRSAPSKKDGPSPSDSALRAQLNAVRGERDALRERLREAEATIAALESRQSQAVNRIDWVLDSLHNVVDLKP